MYINKNFSKLLSDFFLDISKAVFITTFITPTIVSLSNPMEQILLLSKGLINVIFLLLISWQLLEVSKVQL